MLGSVIPKFIRIMAISAAFWIVAGCSASERNPKEAKMATPTVTRELPFTSILNAQDVGGFLTGGGSAAIEMGAPRMVWIRSQKGFHASHFDQAEGLKLPASPPDFDKQDVVLLTLGVQGTTGYGLTLRKAEMEGAKIRFIVDVKSPGPEAAVGEALTEPGEIILISKLSEKAEPVLVADGKETPFKILLYP